MMGSSKILFGLAVCIFAAGHIIDACQENNVTLYLYKGKDNPCKLTTTSCPDYNTCGFDPNARTVVIVHGWAGSYVGDCPTVIKNAYVDKMLQDNKHINIIVVDYGPCATNYFNSVSWTKQIGQFAAKIIQFLVDSCKLNIKLMECIGFSLGSHICGTISAELPVKFNRIIGLDPAAPDMTSKTLDYKLDTSDTPCLVIIHTSCKGLSITDAFGHVDIYPNNAKNQPGCVPTAMGQVLAAGCDHNMACVLCANSILHPTIFPMQKECKTSGDALANTCIDLKHHVGYMGELTCGIHGIYTFNATACLKEHNLL